MRVDSCCSLAVASTLASDDQLMMRRERSTGTEQVETGADKNSGRGRPGSFMRSWHCTPGMDRRLLGRVLQLLLGFIRVRERDSSQVQSPIGSDVGRDLCIADAAVAGCAPMF